MNTITREQVIRFSELTEKIASDLGLELWDFGNGVVKDGFPMVDGKKLDSRTFIIVNKMD